MKKQFLVMLVVVAMLLSSCGGIRKIEDTTATTATTTKNAPTASSEAMNVTTTTGADTTATASSGGSTGIALTEEPFQGKYASMRVPAGFTMNVGSIVEENDTHYYYKYEDYTNPSHVFPFIMYQYELSPVSGVLTDAMWDQVFSNAGVERKDKITVNGREFQYGFTAKANGGAFDFMLYYTFDKGILHAFAAVLKADSSESDLELYRQVLREMIESAQFFSGGNPNATTQSSGPQFTTSGSNAGSPSALPPVTEWDYLPLKGGTIAVPKGWTQVYYDDNLALTVAYAPVSVDEGSGIIYQYLPINYSSDLISTMIGEFGGVAGGMTEIAGREFSIMFPGAEDNMCGYLIYKDGALLSFFYNNMDLSITNEEILEWMRALIEESEI